MADRVTITQLPPADREAMATAMAQASVVAAMSDYESQGIAVTEALSVGRPVVGCDIAAIGELVAEGLVQGVAPEAPPSTVAEQLLKAMSAPTSAALPDCRRGIPQPGNSASCISQRLDAAPSCDPEA